MIVRRLDRLTWSLASLVVFSGAAAGQQATRTVDGRVLDGSADRETPVAGQMVVLHRIASGGAGPLDSVRTDREGNYRFRYRATGDEAVYIVSARYAGVAYFTPPLRGIDVRGDDAVVLVFDTTSRAIPLHVRGRHIVLSAPEANGARRLTEVFEIANDTAVTRIAGANGRSWSVRLPAGARSFEVGRGDIPAEAVRFADDSAHVIAPFAPGLKQLVLRYELPRSAFPLDVTLGHDVGILEVLLEDSTARADAPGLARQDPVSLEGRHFERYMAQDVPGGATLRLAALGGGRRARGMVAILAAAVALSLGALAARRAARVPRAAPLATSAPDEADALAASVAAIDNVVEGAPSRLEALRARRLELEARLDDLLARRRRQR